MNILNTMMRYAPGIGWRTVFRLFRQTTAPSSSSSTACGLNPSEGSESLDKNAVETPKLQSTVESKSEDSFNGTQKPILNGKDKKSTIVAAAFANLKSSDVTDARRKRPLSVDDRIMAADSVASLLSIAENSNVSRRHALRVVSILADWTAVNRIKLTDFEADPRFVKLCKLLGRGIPRNIQDAGQDVGLTGFGDLAMVLGVTGDDEAAKLVSGISLNQMIKVMSTLASKHRRSTPLLRSLAYNIGRSEEMVDVKQGADVLYAMAVLNFPDEALLESMCSNLCSSIAANKKSAVTGSILTSLGHLRYKHTELLDGLSEWMAQNLSICRSQDVVALLLTLATVNHIPANAVQLFDNVIKQVNADDMSTPLSWLDAVWALVILGRATTEHVTSVLDPQFQHKLVLVNSTDNNMNVATKLKLLNINAAAQLLMPNYKGPLLVKESDVYQIPLKRSKEKQILVTAIFDSLSNLLPSATYLRIDANTGMGFILDGECLLDDKCNPLPISEHITNKKTTKVGIMALDYSDMCRGSRSQPCGVADLASRLLLAQGYKVLPIPHTDFNPREKLVTRVQYLEQQLKYLAKQK